MLSNNQISLKKFFPVCELMLDFSIISEKCFLKDLLIILSPGKGRHALVLWIQLK